MNVIAPDGGDFHSVMVKAYNPDARLTKTCPGDPPTVTEEPFGVAYLLNVVWRKNIHCKGHVVFWGEQQIDPGLPYSTLRELLPPGQNLEIAFDALSAGQASMGPIAQLYEWHWGLLPAGVKDFTICD